MSSYNSQNKATTEKHAKILRELVKRPENKVCADCKRNDPRWASWNIGVFLCIRCSGIHRSMGTHISKVKSIDLDKWTPEQMDSIQKWGNRLANLYWEAHLKAGHVPPDHKMESFIRSKYESRRWAQEGAVPSDPSVLDSNAPSSSASSAPSASLKSTPAPPTATTTTTGRQPQNLFDMVDDDQPSFGSSATSAVTRQPKPHALLSTAHRSQHSSSSSAAKTATQPQQPPQAPPSQPQPQPQNDLFSLDFHSPASSQAQTPTANGGSGGGKDVKNDIMSLFSSGPSPVQPQQNQQAFSQMSMGMGMGGGASNPFGSFGNGAPQQAQWGWGNATPQQQPQQQQQQQTHFVGAGGAGSMWAGAPAGGGMAAANVWASSTPTASHVTANSMMFGGDTNAVWGGTVVPNNDGRMNGGNDLFGSLASGGGSTNAQQKKNDAFGDLWGSFK